MTLVYQEEVPIPSPGRWPWFATGVLFLDKLPVFKRTVLKMMRKPMEKRILTISRARLSME